jgi:mannose-6-phosphate isomerase-like protein (cupin superfamily)
LIIQDLADCPSFEAMDKTHIIEQLHPLRHGVDIPYSIAQAILLPGRASLSHRLKTSSEVYIVLEGEGEMHVESERAMIHAGQAFFIPPGSRQHLKNTGSVDLRFICIVYPFLRAEDEEILGSDSKGQGEGKVENGLKEGEQNRGKHAQR